MVNELCIYQIVVTDRISTTHQIISFKMTETDTSKNLQMIYLPVYL